MEFWSAVFGHIIRKEGMGRCIIEGMVEAKIKRRKPLRLWASDFVKLVGGGLADAVHRAADSSGVPKRIMGSGPLIL